MFKKNATTLKKQMWWKQLRVSRGDALSVCRKDTGHEARRTMTLLLYNGQIVLLLLLLLHFVS